MLVTPSYNLNRFIEQTIYSIFGQAGDFSIHYHIQDGGSSDGTADTLAKWKRITSSLDFPKFCREISFTYSIEPDAGMYDAINRGFDLTRKPEAPCVMGWINADDLLMPGALAAVSSFLEQEPSAQLVGGRSVLMSSEGFLFEIFSPDGRLRADVAEGLHDGRTNSFVMQEGTFWRSELWEQVGGLDSSLKLAGDFDLWRRFARHTDYHTLDSLTGVHRKREGQLTSNMTAYHAELESLTTNRQKEESIGSGEVGFFKYDILGEKWLFHLSGARPRWRAISGLRKAEGPYPELAITSARWIVNRTAEIAVWSARCGEYKLAIDFRNPFPAQKIEVAGHSVAIEQAVISRKLNVTTPFDAKSGWNYFRIRLEALAPEHGRDSQLGILIEDVRIDAIRSEPRQRKKVGGPKWTDIFAHHVKGLW
jgi:glycosyltransferase involved in cell wall biosynthesis